MRAVVWRGRHDVRVENVPTPVILNPRDAIVRVRRTAICGSDLHLFDGFIPAMSAGDILGHEFVGDVVEVGPAVSTLSPGDRVAVAFAIACGTCFFCQRGLHSACDNSNPKAALAEAVYGFSGAGLFGYSHLLGGYAGGQAEYVRVPFADVGAFKLPDEVSDEQGVLLTDVFPTGWMAAENCGITPGDVVAVWGCGPVGLLAGRSALLQGASMVVAIDDVPERLRLADHLGLVPLDLAAGDVVERLKDVTAGRGPDACIDCVGMEAHGHTLDAGYDRVRAALLLATDRGHALRTAIQACRKGGTVSIPGVYGGVLDKVPFGAAFAKGLTLKMGQTHVQRYMPMLAGLVARREFDPAVVVTHRPDLDDAPSAYAMFRDKQEGCVKVVLQA